MALPNKPSIKNVWATTGLKVEPSDTKVNTGWIVERPPHQFQNFLQNRSDQFLKHINEAGIPVWDAVTIYTAGKSYVQGSDGKLYKALTSGANQDPVGNPTNWVLTLGESDFQEVIDQTQENALAASISADEAAASEATALATLSVFDDVPPVAPFSGRQWTSNLTGKKYEWIVDADSSQWVEMGPQTTFAATAFGEALAAPATVPAYDYSAVEAQSIFDNALPKQNYTELRAYTGRAKSIRITGLYVSTAADGIAGEFKIDSSDTTSVDNGGTIIVDASNRRWKRIYSGSINIKWFGAVGDGTADDTTSIQTTIDSLPVAGGVVYVPAGAYRITAKLTQTKRVILRGDGISEQPGTAGSSRIIKSASMTTDAIELSVSGSSIESIEFSGEIGNTGNGIYMHAGRLSLKDVAVWRMGGIGVRLGNSSDAVNCNLFLIERVLVRNCGSHGIFIENNSVGAADSNSGLLSMVESSLNGGDGIRVGNAYWVLLNIVTTQVNTGWGVNFTNLSKYNTFNGGDTNEGNLAGQILNDGLGNSFFGHMLFGFVDNGAATTAIGYNQAKVTNLSALHYAKGYEIGLSTTPYTLIAEHTSNSNNGRGVGILLRPPAGSGTNIARDGARIRSEQESTNRDVLSFDVNNSGTMLNMLSLSPGFSGVIPGVDNTINLGVTTRKWKDFYMGGVFSHTGASAGFFGATPVAKPVVSGSRAGNAALDSLLVGLANLGLITNSTSA